MLNRLLARQLRHPVGVLGRLIGCGMDSVNREMNHYTVESMGIEPHHRVLDIGFGGGVGIGEIAGHVDRGLMAGLEISDTMLARAGNRYSKLIKRKRLFLIKGRVEALPFCEATFDRICTVNTVYFWRDLEASIDEIYRVLRPGGLFVLTFRPAEEMQKLKFTRFGFAIYQRQQVRSLLQGGGFNNIRLEEREDSHLKFICAYANKG